MAGASPERPPFVAFILIATIVIFAASALFAAWRVDFAPFDTDAWWLMGLLGVTVVLGPLVTWLVLRRPRGDGE